MSMSRWVLAAVSALIASGAWAGDKSPDNATSMIETVAARKQIKYWKELDHATTWAKMEQDVYRIEGRPGLPPADVAREVDGIWRRLLAASPVPGDPTLYVADCGDRTAESLLTGATRICWGYLRDLQTQDQVAAVLGHELAHLILGHTKSGRGRGTGFAFLNGLYGLAVMGSMVASGGAATPFYATLVGGNNTLAVPTGWLDRANQAEELEADRLGIDLFVKAGFNAGALAEVFEIEGKPCGVAKERTSPKFAL